MPGVVVDDVIPKNDSKSSLPYPSFSKEHSREAVAPRANLNIPTPATTDLDASKDRTSTARHNAPPSPPLTDQTSTAGKWRPSPGKPILAEPIPEEEKDSSSRDSKIRIRLRQQTSTSNGHLRTNSDVGTNGSPTRKHREHTPTRETPLRLATSSQRSVSQPVRLDSPATTTSTAGSGTNISSEATSIAPEQISIQRPGSKAPSAQNTPDVHILSHSRGVTPLEVFIEEDSPSISRGTPATGLTSFTPGPPPPPPAPLPVVVPKVDYLLQHGGLHQTITKNLLLAGKPMAIQQAQSPGQQPIVVANLFEPYTALLDQFEQVMAKNGSLAVATGYRSVARRLLDRLEAVFARDISSENCCCPMCDSEWDRSEDFRGVSWGEVLEFVCGRKDLPAWPPFTFTQSPVGLGISLEFHVPMQKLDIDVPEEYREHYIRQSRKTKQSVDKWLSRQNPGDVPTSPPEEVDDETLTFAILTHLPADQRPTFKDLLGIVDKPIEPPRRIPTPELQNGATRPQEPARTPTPAPRSTPEHVVVASQAIQRLYRLSSAPRDCEAALFLLHNPTLHNTLATLAAISNDEWDILISGRFDGFLRSGADENFPSPDPPHSRGQTPLRPPTRGLTPGYSQSASSLGGVRSRQGSYSQSNTSISAQHGAPIAFDEETELATLAEIERDVYTGMEALEDAFEALHQKAEIVRRALRERSAGLAAAAQRRRGTGIEVRMGTPSSAVSCENGHTRWDGEGDDGLGDWDAVSEIQPDDSASNISSSRRRRPKRRNERRTPALIEEEDEFEGESEGTQSPKKPGYR